jgi:hypothetical protein
MLSLAADALRRDTALTNELFGSVLNRSQIHLEVECAQSDIHSISQSMIMY